MLETTTPSSSPSGGLCLSLNKSKGLVLLIALGLLAYMLLVPGPRVQKHAWTSNTPQPSREGRGSVEERNGAPAAASLGVWSRPWLSKGPTILAPTAAVVGDASLDATPKGTEAKKDDGDDKAAVPPPPRVETTTQVGQDAEQEAKATATISPVTSIPPTPPKTSQEKAVLPSYMIKLQGKYDFDLRTSFSGWTLDYALGPQGILVKVEDRYKRSAEDGIHRVIRSKQKSSWPPGSGDPDGAGVPGEDYAFLRRKANFLGMEQIAGKYGLTNVLMVLSGFLAYGGIANRICVFPQKSPIPMEDLLDINETQAMLAPLNIVILDPGNESDIVDLGAAVTARSQKISLGKRMEIGSADKNIASRALAGQVNGMKKIRKVRYFVQKDFFMAFPFRAIAPFGPCFLMRRLIFTKDIRNAATGVMRALRDGHVVIDNNRIPLPGGGGTERRKVLVGGDGGDEATSAPPPEGAGPTPIRTSRKRVQVNRLMTVHLRLEFDAFMIDQSVKTLSPDEISRFFLEDLIPLARRADCDAIYICAGKLGVVTMDAIKIASIKSGAFPLITKDMIPNIKWRKNLNTKTTSHTGAAADLLIMSHSALAVVFMASTFWISVAAQRCPSPGYGKNASYTRWKVDDARGEALVPWSSEPTGSQEGGIGESGGDSNNNNNKKKDPSSVRGPKPDFNQLLGGSPWKSKSEPGGLGQDRWHSGFFGYRLSQNRNKIEEKPRFSRLHYLGCDQSFGSMCFHDQMLTDIKDGEPVVGDTYSDEFERTQH